MAENLTPDRTGQPRQHIPDALETLVQMRTRRMQAFALATVAGIFSGLGLFLATNILVVRGLLSGDATFAEAMYHGSHKVGPMLSLLSQFFPGYFPTFVGSLVGFVYLFIIGWVVVYFGARIYNAVVDLRGKE